MDPLWSETCWSNFKYLIIILIVSTYYIFVHLLDNEVLVSFCVEYNDSVWEAFLHGFFRGDLPGDLRKWLKILTDLSCLYLCDSPMLFHKRNNWSVRYKCFTYSVWWNLVMSGIDWLMANCSRNAYSKFLPIKGVNTFVCQNNSVELDWSC